MSEENTTADKVDRIDVSIFGVVIGTATGYDVIDGGYQYYELIPNEKFKSLFEKEPDTFSISIDDDTIDYWPKDDEVQNGPGLEIDSKKFFQLLAEQL